MVLTVISGMGQDSGSSPCTAVVGDHLREKWLLARRQGPCLQLTGVTSLALLVWGGPILSLHPALLQQTMVCGAGSPLAGLLLGCELLSHVGVWPCVPLRTSPQRSVLWDSPAGVCWDHGDFVPLLFLPFSLPSVCLSVRSSVCFSAGVSLRESLILVPRLRSAVCTARKGRIKSRAAL